MQKHFRQLISMLLAIAIMLTGAPIMAFGAESTSALPFEQIAYPEGETAEESALSETVYAVSEIVSKRESDTKHYRMSDGSITAVVYPYDVHYMDTDGSYKDIDNSFVDDTDGTDGVLSNKSNGTYVKFMKKSNSNKLYTINQNGHKIKVAIEGVEKVDAVLTEYSDRRERKTGDIDDFTLDNIAGQLTYYGILPNTDIQYTYTSTTLKENIILKNKADFESLVYTYHVDGGVDVVQDSANCISVYERGTKNLVFRVTSPAMWDSEGAEFEKPTLTLCDVKNSKFTVRLDWSVPETAVYPVTVDPVINFRVSGKNINDLHILGQYPNVNYDYNNHIRIRNNAYAMVKYPLPELQSGDKIINAQLVLTPYCYAAPNETAYSMVNSYDPTVKITAHEILRTWNEVTDTYNSIQPENNFYDPTVIDYRAVDGDSALYTWDITRLANRWADGYSENNGVLLKFDQPCPDDWFDAFFISSYAVEVYYGWAFPAVVYQYINTTGIESYLSYHSYSAGYAGTVYTNDLTGNVTLVNPVVSTGGSLMPVSVSLVYNLDNADTETPYGRCWSMNWSQKLERSGIYDFNNNEYLRYRDGDGTEHYFALDSESGTYKDEIDPDRTLTLDSTSGKYTMTDSSDSVAEFTKYGSNDEWYLTKITDPSGNYITVTLDPANYARVTKVQSSTGNTVDFVYSVYGFLTEIKYYDGNATKTVSVEYNVHATPANNGIGRITYADGKAVEYYYADNTVCLSRVEDIDGYHIDFGYTSGSPKRVNSMQEYSSDGQAGYSMSMSYEATATYFHDLTNGRQYLYSFAKNGTLKSTVDVTESDGNGYGLYYEYNGGNTEVVKGMDNLTFVSKTQKSTVNLLNNHSFEASGGFSSTDILNGISSDKSFMGEKSYRLTLQSGTNAQNTLASVNVNVEAGEEYTFSCYVNTSGMTSLGGGASIYADVSGTVYESEVIKTPSDGWQRIMVAFDAETSGSMTVYMSLENATGSVYFDCIQLEKGGLSEYNILENAGFENQCAGWDVYDYGDVTTEEAIGGSWSVTAVGGTEKYVQYRQTHKVKDGKKGDTYVGSAFAKAASVQNNAVDFCVLVRFLDENGETINDRKFSFNRYSTEWQKVSGAASAEEDYASVQLWLLYYHNSNTVYFDNVQLVKDVFGNSYTYDEDGNLISTKDLQGKEENTFTYDGNNQLIKETSISGSTIEYVYDPDIPTRLTEVTSGGVTVKYTYDSNGNVTHSETMTNAAAEGAGATVEAPSITSSATYTQNGEYVTSVTDSRGNTSSFTYNEDRGYVTSETNAKNVTTNYTYNASELLTGLSVQNGSNTSTVTYNYDTNKRLTGIVTPSLTEYTFTLDGFGRTTGVSVGTNSLAKYTYDSKGLLTQMAYGDGTYHEYTLNYEYDSLNRKTGMSQGDVLWYKYRYDGMSRLAEIDEVIYGRTTKYEYDILGRPISERVTENTGNTLLAKLSLRYDDSKNRLSEYHVGIGSANNAYSYIYNTADTVRPDMIMGVKHNGETALTYTYDFLNRQSTRRIEQTTVPFVTEYTYLPGNGDTKTTTLVQSVKNGNDVLTYTYDEIGNILTVSENGTLKESYSYDSLNQLVGATVGSDVYTYSYDNGGNITEVTKNGETVKSFTYMTRQWKDMLKSFNGSANIQYDISGNPFENYDGKSYRWTADRRLTVVTDGSDRYSYAYNESKLRIQKSVNGTVTNYHWLADTLYAEQTGNRYIYYHYDEVGNIYGFTVAEGETTADYYYIRNLQGDVIGILDNSGTKVVSYTYDPWGEILSVTGTLATTIGQLNPIRYRGYYYDNETGYYYCHTRYYNPEICRWINPDSVSVMTLTPTELTDKNLFAYCDNNPITRVDQGGHFWWDIVSFVVSVVDVICNPTDPWAWAGLAGDIVDLIPGITNCGETVRFVKGINKADDVVDAAKVVSKADPVVEVAREIYKTADTTSVLRKSTGSYEIRYKSGYNYVGKGNFNRAISSATRNASKHSDEVVSIMWKSASDARAAFIDEYLLQKLRGGVLSSNKNLKTYNKIWSPGKRYYGD